MCGCSRRATSWASASKRRTNRLSSARSGRITLIATSRFVPGCVAARTRPYVPSPSTANTVYPAERAQPPPLRGGALPDGDRSFERLQIGRRLESRSPRRAPLDTPGTRGGHRPADPMPTANASAAPPAARERVRRSHPVQVGDGPLVLAQCHHHLDPLFHAHQAASRSGARPRRPATTRGPARHTRRPARERAPGRTDPSHARVRPTRPGRGSSRTLRRRALSH